MRRRWLAWAVMLTVTSGCDNVAWGGVDVRLEPPEPKPTAVSRVDVAGGAPEDTLPLPDLPEGPLLLAGLREGSSATLVVVGEIQPDSLAGLPTEEERPRLRERIRRDVLAPGSEFVLFSDGTRVGRLVASETGLDERFCPPRPTVTGTVELVPAASDARRLLALPVEVAGERPYGPYDGVDDAIDADAVSLQVGATAIANASVPWPPSLVESRADLQTFGREGDGVEPAVAATFLFADSLGVGPPDAGNAYALFVVGVPRASGYREGFTWYRRVDAEGKGAPRYFGRLDWDGDGRSELLLDVFGEEHRWFAALSPRGDGWTRSFQDRCSPGSPGG
jgi:hypothetical protein